MTEALLLLACISSIGVIGLLGAIYNWEWIYRSAGARLLTRLIGRSAMRVCTGIAGVVFIVGPWVFLFTRQSTSCGTGVAKKPGQRLRR